MPTPYESGLEKNPANFAPLTPVSRQSFVQEVLIDATGCSK